MIFCLSLTLLSASIGRGSRDTESLTAAGKTSDKLDS